MTEREFMKAAIEKKEKRLSRILAENILFDSLFGGIAGYFLSSAYTACMLDGTPIQIAMTAFLAALGLGIGYFDGKAKAEELRLDLLLLRHLTESEGL